MRRFFYRVMALLARVFGAWLFRLISRFVAAGYFILAPGRVAVSTRFYRALFPSRSLLFYLWCTWRQFQNFTSVFMDRLMLQTGRPIDYSFEGREHLHDAQAHGQGGIVLMSHIGNWEVAAHLLHQSHPDLPLMLYMGQRTRDEIERLQKQDLMAGGIRVVTVNRNQASPFDLVESISFLRSGGFVSMTGDRIWHHDQRALTVTFLGHRIRLPETPHILALLSGAPLFIFLSARTSRRHYHFRLSGPFFIRADTRDQRGQALQQSAQRYARMIEQHLRNVPFEWYHFEPIWWPEAD